MFKNTILWISKELIIFFLIFKIIIVTGLSPFNYIFSIPILSDHCNTGAYSKNIFVPGLYMHRIFIIKQDIMYTPNIS